MNEVVENIIRDIIQILMQEPLTQTILEDELQMLLKNTHGRVKVDKDCNVYFNNVLVPFSGHQSKILYLFYLLSKKGAAFHELVKHEDILKKIIQEVTKKDSYGVEEAVKPYFKKKRVHDMNSKINSALEEVIPKDYISYYRITGKKENTKRIQLLKSRIVIENDVLDKIGKIKF
ncbi:hypothetical protein [Bacteroides sp. 519]|uniref:hypothetical protein n=1 Tax=Bacteroides sp. 519 TaxID=2302937 RepID=UPI0013D8001B|nr:hypothetical protein [Bacteroides sp. 519]NDV57276.1 hypothetical protein [Bacteroides sp. 519]